MITQKDINAVEVLALKEIEKYGSPTKIFFDLANRKGQEIAQTLRADKEIVAMGTRLMDIKLGECISKGKAKEHVKESSDEAKKILSKLGISEEKKSKIINCVEAHHNKKYSCIEAEVCANADCYRFLHPKGIFSYIMLLSSERQMPFEEILEAVEEKMEEKHNILSLDMAKKELEPYYKEFKGIIKEIRAN